MRQSESESEDGKLRKEIPTNFQGGQSGGLCSLVCSICAGTSHIPDKRFVQARKSFIDRDSKIATL